MKPTGIKTTIYNFNEIQKQTSLKIDTPFWNRIDLTT